MWFAWDKVPGKFAYEQCGSGLGYNFFVLEGHMNADGRPYLVIAENHSRTTAAIQTSHITVFVGPDYRDHYSLDIDNFAESAIADWRGDGGCTFLATEGITFLVDAATLPFSRLREEHDKNGKADWLQAIVGRVFWLAPDGLEYTGLTRMAVLWDGADAKEVWRTGTPADWLKGGFKVVGVDPYLNLEPRVDFAGCFKVEANGRWVVRDRQTQKLRTLEWGRDICRLVSHTRATVYPRNYLPQEWQQRLSKQYITIARPRGMREPCGVVIIDKEDAPCPQRGDCLCK